MCTTQSGASASTAAGSVVAVTPTGALAAQHAGVDTVLGRVVHQHADELEVGMAQDRAQRAGADVARRPLHDSDAVHGPGR